MVSINIALIISVSLKRELGSKDILLNSIFSVLMTCLKTNHCPNNAAKGIKINCISPGYTDTPILERFFSTKPDPEAARKEAEFRQPIRRMGTTTEIANTILFMSSDECNYMIGANIIVDGGITLKIHENDDTGAN